MLSRVSFSLDMSVSDHTALIFALRMARRSKQDIFSFYQNNSDAKVLTPLDPLKDDIESLDRLLHVFESSGVWS